MEEIWKDVVGYESRYKVSSTGRIYSIRAGRILKTCISNKGYELACLRGDDGKRSQKTVHRLVATAFLDNPDNLPIINHKDENKLNNSVDNLEWCTFEYNNSYGKMENALDGYLDKIRIACDIYDKNGSLVASCKSAREAAKLLNVWAGCVYYAMDGVCKNGKERTCAGYIIKSSK